jgi:hypothetical protein
MDIKRSPRLPQVFHGSGNGGDNAGTIPRKIAPDGCAIRLETQGFVIHISHSKTNLVNQMSAMTCAAPTWLS